MALVYKTGKNGKKTVTSSYFEDAQLLKSSMADTSKDYRSLVKEMPDFDIGKLQLTSAAKIISLWRQGCSELSEYASSLNAKQCEGVTTHYMGLDWKPVSDEEFKRFYDDQNFN